MRRHSLSKGIQNFFERMTPSARTGSNDAAGLERTRKAERGAVLPVDESLLVMLRERRKGPERVEATEITLAEDPLFAIERRIEEEGDDGETRLTSRIEYVFFSYEEAETYLEQFKYRLHGCRLTVLPTFGSLKRVLRAGEFLDEIERRLAEGAHDGAA